MVSDNRHFRVSAWLKNIIGKELITNDFVAIFELVKNSFDAHATKVKVIFDFEHGNPSIIIADNGKGMSLEDIDKKWLFVAYSAKKTGEEDSERQVYAGNKGVGRFSCDGLGRTLLMETKTRADSEVNQLLVDWGDFEIDPNNEFQDIELDLGTQDGFTDYGGMTRFVKSSGTVLKIEELRKPESWNRDKLLALKNSLQKLVDPFAGLLQNRQLELVCLREKDEDLKQESAQWRVNGPVQNDLFSKIFQKSTVVSVSLLNRVIKTSLTDRGMPIYAISEAVEDVAPELYAASIDFNIAFLNRAAKFNFTKAMRISPVNYGSIFLVRNGFRVYPIGETFDDFWRINLRKQQGYGRYLGTRDLLGCVHLKDPNGLFAEASNREGLVGSAAVDDLRDLVLSAIKRLEAYVTKVIWKDKLDKDEGTPDRVGLDQNRIRVIRLVEELALSSKVRIDSYNKDLISILDAKSPDHDDALTALKTIAERFNNPELTKSLQAAESKIQDYKRQRREAEEKARQEEEARRRAEEAQARADREARRTKRELDAERKRALFLMSSGSRDKDILECYMHEITSYNNHEHALATTYMLEHPSLDEDGKEFCAQVLLISEKIGTAAKFAISAGFHMVDSLTEKPVDVATFIREYVEKIRMVYESAVRISCEMPSQVFKVRVNPMTIGLIIENLANNARKAHAKNMAVSFDVKSKFIDVIFSDDGDGLAPDLDAESIFERGVTRTWGSGLGLYYSRMAAKDAKYELSLRSARGPMGGCEFLLRITNEPNLQSTVD